jgi:hypothetical protein
LRTGETAALDEQMRTLKWKLWHGQVDRAIQHLERMIADMTRLCGQGDLSAWRVWNLAQPLVGTVRNFVCDRAVEHYAAMALMKRSPKMTANWAFAIDHSLGGIFHSFSERFKIKYKSFVAASSLGKWPLALTARRSVELSASMAFVV